jgi:hypothetical protein
MAGISSTGGGYPVGCSKRLSRRSSASEAASFALRYVDPLSDARTPLVDFFSILLECLAWKGGLYSRVGFSLSLRLPVPKGPGPLHSILPALFRAHESFQTGGDQGHKIRLVSGRELDNPPWRAGVRR